MSMSNSLETGLLGLLFNATTFANIAVNATSGPLTNLYVSLHTADPGEGGDQTTSEAAYSGYARQPLVRTSSGWTVSGGTVNPASTISFPAAVSGGETETFMGIGSLVSGAGVLYLSGAISPTIGVSAGVTPQLTTATAITFD